MDRMRLWAAAALVAAVCQAAHGQAAPDIKTIIRELGSRIPENRATAAIMLGEMGGKASDAVPTLIKLLADNTWVVKKVQGMRDTADRTRVVMTPKGLGVRTTVAREAAIALSRIGDPRAAEPLLRIIAARDADFDIREEAENGLVSMGAPALKTMVEHAERGGDPMQPAAIRVLSMMGGPGAEALIGLMRKAAEKDAFLLAQALGDTHDMRALGALIEVLKSKKSTIFQAAAVAGMERFCRSGSPAGRKVRVPYQEELSQRSELARIFQAEAVEALNKYLANRSEKAEYRVPVCDILKAALDPRSVPELAAALKEPNERIHYGAFYALSRLAHEAADRSEWFGGAGPDAPAWKENKAALLQALQAGAVKPLIDYLCARSADTGDRALSFRQEIVETLKNLTGKEFLDGAAWQAWWKKDGAAQAPKMPVYQPPGAATAPAAATVPAAATAPAAGAKAASRRRHVSNQPSSLKP